METGAPVIHMEALRHIQPEVMRRTRALQLPSNGTFVYVELAI